MRTKVFEIPSNVSVLAITTNVILSPEQVARVKKEWEKAFATRPAKDEPFLICLPKGWKIEVVKPREMVEGDL